MGSSNCACCGAIFCLLILGASATLIAWAFTSFPSAPHFSVDSASISGYNLTADNNLTSTFTLNITGHNPNAHYFITYDVVMVSVYNNATLLAYEVLPGPFHHHPKAQLSLMAAPVAHNVPLLPLSNTTTTVGDLRAAGSSAGTANLEVRVRAVTRLKIKGWQYYKYMMKAVCSPVTVKFNSSSDASAAHQTPCHVNFY